MSDLKVPTDEIRAAQAKCDPNTMLWFGYVQLSTNVRHDLLEGNVSRDVTVRRHLRNYLKFFSGEAPIPTNHRRSDYDELIGSEEFVAAVAAITRSLADNVAMSAKAPPVIRIRFPAQEHLFTVDATFGQSGEGTADLVVHLFFSEGQDYELLTDETEPSADSDEVTVAINRCWLHVEWEGGRAVGDDQEWVSHSGVVHSLKRGGGGRLPHWQLEAKASGVPISGRFEDLILCQLQGKDRTGVRLLLKTRANGLKVATKVDEQVRTDDLKGNERLKALHRLVSCSFSSGASQPEFNENDSLTLYDETVRPLDGI